MKCRRYSVLAALLCACLILSVGCAAAPDPSPAVSPGQEEPAPADLSPDRAVLTAFTRDDATLQDVRFSECTPVLPDGAAPPEGATLQYAAADGRLFYWVIEPIPMANYAARSRLFSMDLEDGSVSLLYSVEDEGHWINEFTANDDGLYWVLQCGETTKLQRMALSGGQPEDLRITEEPVLILTECGPEHLVWTEETQQSKLLYAWPTDGSGEPFVVSDHPVSYTSYSRVRTADNLFPVLKGTADAPLLTVYDLSQNTVQTQLTAEPGAPVSRPQVNGRGFLVWSGSDLSELYVRDQGDGSILRTNFGDSAPDVFSFHLWGSMLIVNDRGSDRLLCYDLEHGTWCAAGPSARFLTGFVMGNGWFVIEHSDGVLIGWPQT